MVYFICMNLFSLDKIFENLYMQVALIDVLKKNQNVCFEEPSKIDNIFMMKYFIVVNFIGQLCECSHYENCVRDFMKNQFRKL